jgi:YfiH family protein
MPAMDAVILETIPGFPAVSGLHAVLSTRHGGVSEGPYATLNLGYHVEDDPARVTANRRRLAEAAGYPATALITAAQVHGAAVAWVTAADRGRGALDRDTAVPAVDGLATDAPGTPLAMLVADCAPVLLADPVHRALAVVHAGWRGALGRIVAAGVQMLMARVGSDPAALLAGVGPTLCPACFEVGDEVAALAADWSGAVVRGAAKPHLDLRAVLRADLAVAGVPADQVWLHPACPCCQTARFFSYRGQGGPSGRFSLTAWWE